METHNKITPKEIAILIFDTIIGKYLRWWEFALCILIAIDFGKWGIPVYLGLSFFFQLCNQGWKR